MFAFTSRLVAALVLIFGFSACSKKEKLYNISGTVTHAGTPIPKGVIKFVPREDGPQGFANIWNGKFDTAKEGQGIRGGAYDISVLGFDGKQVPDAPFGNALFPEYTSSKDLPQADTTYDLDVPKTR